MTLFFRKNMFRFHTGMSNTEPVAKVMVTREGWRCERCGHEWVPRDMAVKPRTCGACKSPYWDRPRRIKKTDQERSTP